MIGLVGFRVQKKKEEKSEWKRRRRNFRHAEGIQKRRAKVCSILLLPAFCPSLG